MAKLVFEDSEIRLSPLEPNLLGRDSEICNVILDDATVSKKHCQITLKGKFYVVQDLNSTTGTFVNEEPVKPGESRILSDGDTIWIGDVQSEFYENVELLEQRKRAPYLEKESALDKDLREQLSFPYAKKPHCPLLMKTLSGLIDFAFGFIVYNVLLNCIKPSAAFASADSVVDLAREAVLNGLQNFMHPTSLLIASLVICANRILLPAITGGKTIGKFVNITRIVTHEGSRVQLWPLIVRELSLTLPTFSIVYLALRFPINTAENTTTWFYLAMFILIPYLIGTVIIPLNNAHQRSYYEMLSGTRTVLSF